MRCPQDGSEKEIGPQVLLLLIPTPLLIYFSVYAAYNYLYSIASLFRPRLAAQIVHAWLRVALAARSRAAGRIAPAGS